MEPKPYRFGVSEFTTWFSSFEEDLENYVRLGVDTIEVCEFKLSQEHAGEPLARVAEEGLTISSVQPRLHSLFPDAPRPEPADPRARMALFRESIVRFSRVPLEGPLITITGAALEGNYREAWAVAEREYRALADFAADHNVRIAVEPLNPILMNVDTFLCSLDEGLRLVETVDRPNFGIFLDVWHFWQDRAAEAKIRACGDRIFGVHVNDWHTPRHFGDRANIGEGMIPLPQLLRAIQETGYRGAYTLEIFSVDSLPDSLWRTDPADLIQTNQKGFESAWKAAREL